MENNQIIYAYAERKEKKFNQEILMYLCCPAYIYLHRQIYRVLLNIF